MPTAGGDLLFFKIFWSGFEGAICVREGFIDTVNPRGGGGTVTSDGKRSTDTVNPRGGGGMKSTEGGGASFIDTKNP